MKRQVVLVLSDMHCPYNHPDSVAFLKAVKDKYKPNLVYSVGDIVDFHSISFHDHDPDLDSPGKELERAIVALQPIYKLFPKMTIVESNHDSLVYRKGYSSGLPKAVFRSYNEILHAPKGWVWKDDDIFETPLGPVYICHGRTGTPGKLSAMFGMSAIEGHRHSLAQIFYTSTPERLLWHAHVGCLINDKALAFNYNKLSIKRPIISVMVVDNGIPAVVPMVLTRKGRWIGKL